MLGFCVERTVGPIYYGMCISTFGVCSQCLPARCRNKTKLADVCLRACALSCAYCSKHHSSSRKEYTELQYYILEVSIHVYMY